jgi:cobalt-zinc-cadmium resistance protein CzcA
MQAMRIPGTSLTQSVEMQQQLERRWLKRIPRDRARVSPAPAPRKSRRTRCRPTISDGYIMLKPRDQWPDPKNARRAAGRRWKPHPRGAGQGNYEFSQPIQLRFNELISGVRSDVAVKVFGDDLGVLAGPRGRCIAACCRTSGRRDVKTEQTSGLPMLTVKIDRKALARFGLRVGRRAGTWSRSRSAARAGTVFEGDRRFDIVVRLPDELRTDIDAIKRLPIPLPPLPARRCRRRSAPLAQMLHPAGRGGGPSVAPGPNQISREDGKRRVVVSANVRGRDIGSSWPRRRKAIAQKVKTAGRATGSAGAASSSSCNRRRSA